MGGYVHRRMGRANEPESQNTIISVELAVGVQKPFRGKLVGIRIYGLVMDHGPGEVESFLVKRMPEVVILTIYWRGQWCLRQY